MKLELRHIRYFLAVTEERHFTRAAAKLGIGQPPLSQQIKDLEGEVGASLFHRVAHGAELTEAGEAFLAWVREMPLLAEKATLAARRGARGETGSLRVGFTASESGIGCEQALARRPGDLPPLRQEIVCSVMAETRDQRSKPGNQLLEQCVEPLLLGRGECV